MILSRCFWFHSLTSFRWLLFLDALKSRRWKFVKPHTAMWRDIVSRNLTLDFWQKQGIETFYFLRWQDTCDHSTISSALLTLWRQPFWNFAIPTMVFALSRYREWLTGETTVCKSHIYTTALSNQSIWYLMVNLLCMCTKPSTKFESITTFELLVFVLV